ncbi:WXG100 family type VII secretion target [Actinomycetota bacterium]
MEFTPGCLESFAGVLADGGSAIDLAGVYHQAATDYIETHCVVGPHQGIAFNGLSEANEHNVAFIRGENESIGNRFSSAANALRAAEAEYIRMDAAGRDALDATYPGATLPDPTTTPAGTSWIRDPAAVLTDPGVTEGTLDLAGRVLDLANFASVGVAVITILSWFGCDPAGMVADAVGGDTSELFRVGEALGNLAERDTVAAQDIPTAMVELSALWTGNASDGAQEYFAGFASGLEDRAAKLRDLGQDYTSAALALETVADVVCDLLIELIDFVIGLIAKVAGAAVPYLTVLMGIWAASDVAQLIDKVTRFIDLCGDPLTIGLALAALSGDEPDLGNYDTTLAIPAVSYHHPGLAGGPGVVTDAYNGVEAA